MKLDNTIIGYESEFDSDDGKPTKFLDQQNISQVNADTYGNGDNRHESMFSYWKRDSKFQSFQFICGEKKELIITLMSFLQSQNLDWTFTIIFLCANISKYL